MQQGAPDASGAGAAPAPAAGQAPQGQTRKIFVGGLASHQAEADVQNYFQQFGAISEVLVMRDMQTQRPRGFGFVTFESEDTVVRVVVNRFHSLDGKQVEVKAAVPRGDQSLASAPGGRGGGFRGGGNGYGAHGGAHGGAYGGFPNQGAYGGGYGRGGPGPYGGYPGAGRGFGGPQQGFGGPGQMGYGGPAYGQQPGGFEGNMGGMVNPAAAGGAQPHGWTVHTAPDGTLYYYNEFTGVSQWERPKEL
jgi:RNA-binding protein Musashi